MTQTYIHLVFFVTAKNGTKLLRLSPLLSAGVAKHDICWYINDRSGWKVKDPRPGHFLVQFTKRFRSIYSGRWWDQSFFMTGKNLVARKKTCQVPIVTATSFQVAPSPPLLYFFMTATSLVEWFITREREFGSKIFGKKQGHSERKLF